jgi:tetratricopeptide (TPR) repeat protein
MGGPVRGAARGATLGAVLLCIAAPAAVSAQAGDLDEVAMMRQVTLAEAAGDLAGAEAALLSILEHRPASAPALLALERVLMQQRRLAELPPRVASGLRSEPRSALLNQLQIRTYSRLDLTRELEAAAQAWIAAAPETESAYRHVARTWEARGDYGRARAALEQGRRRVPGDDALAFELGALYGAMGDHRLAAEEWARAIGRDGQGLSQVRRGLRALPDGGAAVVPTLVDRLAAEPATRERLTAAVELAVAAGLESTAAGLAERLAPMHPEGGRGAFLLDLARRADGAGLRRLAYWAYGELLGHQELGALAAVRGRFAELALALGETGPPDAGHARPDGSPNPTTEDRSAEALRIRGLASHDVHAASEALRAFRDSHREAPEVDGLAAAVAEALLAGGDRDQAERVLTGVRGPRSALLRGRLALARGDRDGARSAFLAAAPSLAGTDATRALALAALLGRVSPDGAALLARALEDVGREGGGDLGALVDGVRRLPAGEQAAILEFGASMADGAGLTEDADRIRRLLVSEHPRASETPAALLALARSMRSLDDVEARELLDRLIIEYPRSALVPQARRELDQLRREAAAVTRDSGS